MRMIDELERIWKEAVVTYSRYYRGTYLAGLRNTKKFLSRDSQDSNQAPTEYNSRALPLDQSVR
jgi:hypothetical protein